MNTDKEKGFLFKGMTIYKPRMVTGYFIRSGQGTTYIVEDGDWYAVEEDSVERV